MYHFSINKTDDSYVFYVKQKEVSHSDTSFDTLIVLSFSSCFRFLLTLNAWLLVMFSFTNLLLDTCLRAVSLETT